MDDTEKARLKAETDQKMATERAAADEQQRVKEQQAQQEQQARDAQQKEQARVAEQQERDRVARNAQTDPRLRQQDPHLSQDPAHRSVMDQNRDAELAKARGEPVEVISNVAPTVTVDPLNPKSAEAQHAAVDERMDKLNEHNAKGFAVIEERDARTAELAQNNPTHVPTGKEWNRNTPVIDEHGNKSW